MNRKLLLSNINQFILKLLFFSIFGTTLKFANIFLNILLKTILYKQVTYSVRQLKN